jgi:uncharacterized membrane protein YkvA (DUF1232 family)
MEEKRNWLGPYIPQGNMIREVAQQAKLAYNLMWDPRVHIIVKLIPLVPLAYLILPADLIPDLLVGLGQLDDAAIIMLSMRLFFELAPQGVVHEQLKRILAQDAAYDAPTTPSPSDWKEVSPTSGETIPKEGEVVDENK